MTLYRIKLVAENHGVNFHSLLFNYFKVKQYKKCNCVRAVYEVDLTPEQAEELLEYNLVESIETVNESPWVSVSSSVKPGQGNLAC